MSTLNLAMTIVPASIASALAVILLFEYLQRRRPAATPPLTGPLEPTVFLFDDQDVIDATPPARALLDNLPGAGSDWDRLAAFVSTRLPDFRTSMADLARRGQMRLVSQSHPEFSLSAEHLGNVARITLADLSREGHGIVVDSLSYHAQEEEITSLRSTVAATPIPIWRTDATGGIIWASQSYLDLVQHVVDDMTWPLPALFDPASQGSRQQLAETGGWYEIACLPVGGDLLHYALPADNVVRAEGALREFVQTLSKTFAQLPIGLAVFDRQRQLALFNPALLDLTTLGGGFLTARPTLFAFLDALREARIVPEPKDYTNWRQRMTELEKAAASGLYEETWSLPSGLTYRVTGRPHPDGAVAFLFEDISAEISLTRRFRAEIELGQSVIDAMDEAIAVFSDTDELTISNRAYARLWGIDPAATLAQVTLLDAVRHWQAMSRPNPAWAELPDARATLAGGSGWDCAARLKDGCTVTCRVTPMARGAILVRFSIAPEERAMALPPPAVITNAYMDLATP